jgi:D-sedoheptulose 7-phosphate isomerase
MHTFSIETQAKELSLVLDEFKNSTDFEKLKKLGQVLVSSILSNQKIILFGNGGSAAEASHFATELVSRCTTDHNPWPAFCLSDSATSITAIGNDYGFEHIFERQLEAIAQSNDVVIAFSTSGSSENILRALRLASNKNCISYLLTGAKYKHDPLSGWNYISVPSLRTTRVQEIHLFIIHLLSEFCESKLI